MRCIKTYVLNNPAFYSYWIRINLNQKNGLKNSLFGTISISNIKTRHILCARTVIGIRSFLKSCPDIILWLFLWEVSTQNYPLFDYDNHNCDIRNEKKVESVVK